MVWQCQALLYYLHVLLFSHITLTITFHHKVNCFNTHCYFYGPSYWSSILQLCWNRFTCSDAYVVDLKIHICWFFVLYSPKKQTVFSKTLSYSFWVLSVELLVDWEDLLAATSYFKRPTASLLIYIGRIVAVYLTFGAFRLCCKCRTINFRELRFIT